MKLQIDTAVKTIKVEHIVNLGELMKALSDMFPDGAWREYSIEPTVIQNWNNPIWVDPNPVQPYQWPWNPNKITFGTGTADPQPPAFTTTDNVFNVDYGGAKNSPRELNLSNGTDSQV